MKKTTRDYDLEELEQYRDAAVTAEARKQRSAILELVYQQAKDPVLEKLRIRLTDAMKRGDLKEFAAVRDQVKNYASRKTFVTDMFTKMKRVSKERAQVYVAKK